MSLQLTEVAQFSYCLRAPNLILLRQGYMLQSVRRMSASLSLYLLHAISAFHYTHLV